MNREELVEALFEEFDTNKDGVISRLEFKELIECLFGRYGHQTSQEIFKEFDRNEDNVISKEELHELIIEHGI